MSEWHSEEEIKAQLRELTEETRKLRKGLDDLIRPHDPRPGTFRHRHSWPAEAPRAAANDRRTKKR